MIVGGYRKQYIPDGISQLSTKLHGQFIFIPQMLSVL